VKGLIDKLAIGPLDSREMLYLLDNIDADGVEYLTMKANEVRIENCGKAVYMRGLVEFTNYCGRDCLYCGIRASNRCADRYRLTPEEIVSTCQHGFELGYRTFVLQGGEDNHYTDDLVVRIISEIKEKCPDCAVTLSIGEKSYKSYKKFYDAGADRYLLRHETASPELYSQLHSTSLDNRIECLYNLKEIGYQVGTGFMVGLPNQTNEDFVKDLEFIYKLQPHMVGIGPFIPHKDTPLGDYSPGTVEKTCILLSIIRLLLPCVLLPATTSLGTIDPEGRVRGLKAGANVVMPNLSPVAVRSKYALYDGKAYMGEEAVEFTRIIKENIIKAGFEPSMARGDSRMWRGRGNEQ
jgi:biotin synthase